VKAFFLKRTVDTKILSGGKKSSPGAPRIGVEKSQGQAKKDRGKTGSGNNTFWGDMTGETTTFRIL